ncbi:hypothetical protein DPEC_G00205070, partial [Dallia pectoralis]
MAEGYTYLVEGEVDNAERDVIEGQVGVGRGLFFRPLEPRTPGPSVTALHTPQLTSTRYVDRAMPSKVEQNPDLGSLITQLAEKLGESITAKLQSDRCTHNTSTPVQPSEMTLPNVKVVMQSDVREPSIFRGDSSDKFTVHEWEKLMTLYLKKRAIPVIEHSQEVLAKLMGKAGDVVRINLRNNTSIDHAANPHVIFDILKQHFSDLTHSSMPLADFYNTLPLPGEDAMEYWIRLNKTVDVADEYLKRQGRSIDDPGHEVSMMFSKYCPDQSLAGVFKFKSAERWSACEIQERLDEHMQGQKSLQAATVRSLKPSTVEHKVHSQCHVPMADNTPAPNTTVPSVPSPVPMTNAVVDNVCMRSLVNLLDRLVTQQTQVPAHPRVQTAVPNSSQKVCRVCRASDHSTLAHCRKEDRCLK